LIAGAVNARDGDDDADGGANGDIYGALYDNTATSNAKAATTTDSSVAVATTDNVK
jgi:hypothetical protein